MAEASVAELVDASGAELRIPASSVESGNSPTPLIPPDATVGIAPVVAIEANPGTAIQDSAPVQQVGPIPSGSDVSQGAGTANQSPVASTAGGSVTSKVQLVAEAFRRKSAAKTAASSAPRFPKPTVTGTKSTVRALTSIPVPADLGGEAQQVTVSPVVELEETLDLQEITGEGVLPDELGRDEPPSPPQEKPKSERAAREPQVAAPTGPLGSASRIDVVSGAAAPAFPATSLGSPTLEAASLEATSLEATAGVALKLDTPSERAQPVTEPSSTRDQNASRDRGNKPAVVVTPGSGPSLDRRPDSRRVQSESGRRDSGRTKHGGATRGSESSLSLDASYAVEFFSASPPPTQFQVEVEPEIEQESPRVRSPEQLARQAYLRRLVIKVMLVAGLFVAVVVFMMWHRGLFRVLH